jgi:hypothetical protein
VRPAQARMERKPAAGGEEVTGHAAS